MRLQLQNAQYTYPSRGPSFTSRQQTVWVEELALNINGLEELWLSKNCLIISLGGLEMGRLGLIVSLETFWTAIWEFWPLFCNLSAIKCNKSDHETGNCLESVCTTTKCSIYLPESRSQFHFYTADCLG